MGEVQVIETKKRKRSLSQKNKITGWIFVSVASILIFIFSFYPMFQAFLLSFQAGFGTNLEFVGLDNYVRLLSDTFFLTAVQNTFFFLIIQVPVMLLLGLIMAALLNTKNLRGKGFFRTAIFLPAITSLVAYSVVFRYLFGTRGVINVLLQNLQLIDAPIQWLTDPHLARILIVIAITWRWTGYNTTFYISGMQNIDNEIYEAATIDGASAIQKFFKITLPMLKPIILFTSITSTIGTLQLFDEVMNITNGGPGNATMTISQYIFDLTLGGTPQFGYAATVSYAIVFMVIILSIIQFKVAGDRK